jgi:putative membrane protein
MRLILHWILSALCLLIVAHLVPGFVVRSFFSALIAAVVIGLVNATLGLLLKVLTLPLTIVTFGIFLLIINAWMLKVAAFFTPGFYVVGYWPALLGAVILALLHLLIRMIMRRTEQA